VQISFKIKKILEPLKYWAPDQKKQFMPLVEYAQKLELKVKMLEDIVRRHQAPQLGTSFPEGEHMSRSFLTADSPQETVLSRDERIWQGIKKGEQDSEAFKRLLKWSTLTESQAFEIYSKLEALKLTETNG